MDENSANPPNVIEGQLNAAERGFIANTILNAPQKPQVALEVGTWLGGGSTLHILRALEKNGAGHLYGIEAGASIYKRMLENIQKAAPETADRFTPVFGYSDEAIPALLARQPADFKVDFVFLDGGNNPMEQTGGQKITDALSRRTIIFTAQLECTCFPLALKFNTGKYVAGIVFRCN